MKKAVNRYLNLVGAPYIPSKPNSTITLNNYFTAAATSLAIFGAGYVNPAVEKNQLIHLGEGILGSALSVYLVSRRRKKEAEKISSRANLLVIDTAPEKSSPPTSPEILSRVMGLKKEYNNLSLLSINTLGGAFTDLAMGMTDAAYLLYTQNPHFCALAMPYFTIHGMDLVMRYQQLKKIENLEWVITDQGDAVRNFQKEDAHKLANSPNVAMAPSGLK